MGTKFFSLVFVLHHSSIVRKITNTHTQIQLWLSFTLSQESEVKKKETHSGIIFHDSCIALSFHIQCYQAVAKKVEPAIRKETPHLRKMDSKATSERQRLIHKSAPRNWIDEFLSTQKAQFWYDLLYTITSWTVEGDLVMKMSHLISFQIQSNNIKTVHFLDRLCDAWSMWSRMHILNGTIVCTERHNDIYNFTLVGILKKTLEHVTENERVYKSNANLIILYI